MIPPSRSPRAALTMALLVAMAALGTAGAAPGAAASGTAAAETPAPSDDPFAAAALAAIPPIVERRSPGEATALQRAAWRGRVCTPLSCGPRRAAPLASALPFAGAVVIAGCIARRRESGPG